MWNEGHWRDDRGNALAPYFDFKGSADGGMRRGNPTHSDGRTNGRRESARSYGTNLLIADED